MKIDENKVSNLQKSLYVPINQSLFTESEKEIEVNGKTVLDRKMEFVEKIMKRHLSLQEKRKNELCR